MKVRLTNGQLVHVSIKHYKDNILLTHGRYVRGTDVAIKDANSHMVIAFARSYCKPPDNFCKRKGLGLALVRAFKDAKLNRADRKLIGHVIYGKVKQDIRETVNA